MAVHVALAAVLASSYVFSIYVFRPEHLRLKHRDETDVIHHRIRRVTLLCVFWIVVLPGILTSNDGTLGYWEIVRTFGLIPGFSPNPWTTDLINVVRSLATISVLYAGVIFDYVCSIESTSQVVDDFKDTFLSIQGFRSHAFAPVSEELIYRCLIIRVMVYGGTKPSERALAWTPLFFGLAHIHHAVILARTTKLPKSMIVFNAAFQTLYTTVFGLLANHFYLQSGSLWCPTVVHAVCNILSFPALTVSGSKLYQTVYYSLLLFGTVVFCRLINLL